MTLIKANGKKKGKREKRIEKKKESSTVDIVYKNNVH